MLTLVLSLAACDKSPSVECPYRTTTAVASATEIANLKTYLDANALPYAQHPSGVFYQVKTQGSGTVPGVCSAVTVKYKGSLTNGTAFDSSYSGFPDGITFTLGEVIPGWQIGVPLIQKGGSIILYIPPSLGYGAAGSGTAIPPNSNLVFNVELLDVQ